MITETITIDSQTLLTVQYKGSPAFMYSRTPLLISDPSKTLSAINLRVSNPETGASFIESRQFYNGDTAFDLSAIMRHLSPDVTSLLSSQRGNQGASEYFTIELIYADDIVWTKSYYYAIFGALNANESYRSKALDASHPEVRRIWVNYPQTFCLNQDIDDNHYFVLPSGTKIAAQHDNPDYFSIEDDLVEALGADGRDEAQGCLEALRAGTPQLVGLSNYAYVNAQAEQKTFNGPYWLKLLPDLTPALAPGRTYLRWLQRDGSFGYWLFYSGELQVVASEGTSFQRYYASPDEPSYFGNYAQFDSNSRQADFSETRTLNLGTTVETLEEFEYLAGLMTSPVVDRYVISGENGGEHAGWERVNVLPSSQAYSRKRSTPRLRQIELTIQLPDRDTIKL